MANVLYGLRVLRRRHVLRVPRLKIETAISVYLLAKQLLMRLISILSTP